MNKLKVLDNYPDDLPVDILLGATSANATYTVADLRRWAALERNAIEGDPLRAALKKELRGAEAALFGLVNACDRDMSGDSVEAALNVARLFLGITDPHAPERLGGTAHPKGSA